MTQQQLNANDLALIILHKCHEKNIYVTNQRLQKLLYFVQALYVKHYDRFLFLDEIEAWAYGPAVPSVYSTYRRYGGTLIGDVKEYIDFHFVKHTLNEVKISEEDERLIESVIKMTAEISTSELIDISMHQSPWIETYNPYKNCVISLRKMQKRFSKIYNEL